MFEDCTKLDLIHTVCNSPIKKRPLTAAVLLFLKLFPKDFFDMLAILSQTKTRQQNINLTLQHLILVWVPKTRFSYIVIHNLIIQFFKECQVMMELDLLNELIQEKHENLFVSKRQKHEDITQQQNYLMDVLRMSLIEIVFHHARKTCHCHTLKCL